MYSYIYIDTLSDQYGLIQKVAIPLILVSYKQTWDFEFWLISYF